MSVKKAKGRPPKLEKRIEPWEVAEIKREITGLFSGNMNAFYRDVLDEALSSNADYKGYTKPKVFSSVKRTFERAFAGQDPLPDFYWKALENIGISRDALGNPNAPPIPYSTAKPDNNHAAKDAGNPNVDPKTGKTAGLTNLCLEQALDEIDELPETDRRWQLIRLSHYFLRKRDMRLRWLLDSGYEGIVKRLIISLEKVGVPVELREHFSSVRARLDILVKA
jgi:hypothetical protein